MNDQSHYTEAVLAVTQAKAAIEAASVQTAIAYGLIAVTHAILSRRDEDLLRVQQHIQGI